MIRRPCAAKKRTELGGVSSAASCNSINVYIYTYIFHDVTIFAPTLQAIAAILEGAWSLRVRQAQSEVAKLDSSVSTRFAEMLDTSARGLAKRNRLQGNQGWE